MSRHPIGAMDFQTTATSLRAYQLRIATEVGARNSLILLPTGAGKTLIAAEVIRRRSDDIRGGTSRAEDSHQAARLPFKTLFLVPTCFLVGQQAQALRSHRNNHQVGEYMGGLQFPSGADILVSTPQAFISAQRRYAEQLNWDNWDLVVFDEVHHVLKDHPYRKIALNIPEDSAVQVLGLTASLTYAVTEAKVTAAAKRLARELRIEHMASATVHELQSSGYHATHIEAEVNDEILVPTLQEFGNGRGAPVPPDQRKPHLMHHTFWQRQKQGSGSRFAIDLLKLIRRLEVLAVQIDNQFQSPLERQKKLSKWAAYAVSMYQKSKRRNAPCRLLEHWYEALRIVVMSWEERDGNELAVMFLRMMKCHEPGSYHELSTAAGQMLQWAEVAAFFEAFEVLPRFDHLKGILAEKKESFQLKFRGIIFVQQKTTAHTLTHFVNMDNGLRRMGFKAVTLHSVTTDPPTPSLSLTTREAQANMEGFSSGAHGVNLLITTVVAEEGVDIASANCVIRFDPVLTGVSFVQGRGRARQADSSFVIMSQRPDRPAELLAGAEQLQHRIVSSFEPHLMGASSQEDLRKEKEAQASRERGARDIVKASVADGRYGSSGNKGRWLGDMHLFCKKTKVVLKEQAVLNHDKKWCCTLGYSSILRKAEGTGSGTTKNEAKRQAALGLLRALDDQIQ